MQGARGPFLTKTQCRPLIWKAMSVAYARSLEGGDQAPPGKPMAMVPIDLFLRRPASQCRHDGRGEQLLSPSGRRVRRYARRAPTPPPNYTSPSAPSMVIRSRTPSPRNKEDRGGRHVRPHGDGGRRNWKATEPVEVRDAAACHLKDSLLALPCPTAAPSTCPRRWGLLASHMSFFFGVGLEVAEPCLIALAPVVRGSAIRPSISRSRLADRSAAPGVRQGCQFPARRGGGLPSAGHEPDSR